MNNLWTEDGDGMRARWRVSTNFSSLQRQCMLKLDDVQCTVGGRCTHLHPWGQQVFGNFHFQFTIDGWIAGRRVAKCGMYQVRKLKTRHASKHARHFITHWHQNEHDDGEKIHNKFLAITHICIASTKANRIFNLHHIYRCIKHFKHIHVKFGPSTAPHSASTRSGILMLENKHSFSIRLHNFISFTSGIGTGRNTSNTFQMHRFFPFIRHITGHWSRCKCDNKLLRKLT